MSRDRNNQRHRTRREAQAHLWPWLIPFVILASAALTACDILDPSTWGGQPPAHPRWCENFEAPDYNETRAMLRSESNDNFSSPDGRISGSSPPAGLNLNLGGSSASSMVPPIDVNGFDGGLADAPASSSTGDPGDDQTPDPYFDAYVQSRLAEADGSPSARAAGDKYAMSRDQQRLASYHFVWHSLRGGTLGFRRLALGYLDPAASALAEASPANNPDHRRRLYVPFCPDAEFTPIQSATKAYRYFKFEEICVAPGDATAWLEAMIETAQWSRGEVQKLDSDAQRAFDFAANLLGRYSNGKQPPDFKTRKALFCLGKGPPNVMPIASCFNARNPREALRLGDSKYAESKSAGRKEEVEQTLREARLCWRAAINLAKKANPIGAEDAITAQRRLQTTATTCRWSGESLTMITRDYEARRADIIRVSSLQYALRALGHYDGPIDDQLSPMTRAAVRKFQREREEDETDVLTPFQITMLMCNAAEATRDLSSENNLGIMYIVGLGVRQNIDKAQQWLTDAANRGYPDAIYNLALLHGTGIILSSYRMCDIPRAPEQADKYLQEAAHKGQRDASRLLSFYGPGSRYGNLTAPDRWLLIERQELEHIRNGPFANKLQRIGQKCVYDGNGR